MLGTLVSVSLVAGADLSVEQYWQLTKARLELSSMDWQERLTAATQANGNRETLIEQSAAIAAIYRTRHDQLLTTFGVTQQAYRHYAADHAREIESFLDGHAELKRELDDLRKTIQTSIDSLDAIVGAAMKGPAK
jgi:ABC-type transporter Mla subunit MlaD